jgi:hypothetical protein
LRVLKFDACASCANSRCDAIKPSLHVANRSLICHLAASTVGHCDPCVAHQLPAVAPFFGSLLPVIRRHRVT